AALGDQGDGIACADRQGHRPVHEGLGEDGSEDPLIAPAWPGGGSPGNGGGTRPREASARPSGREAPAGGGAGAGRVLGAPGRDKRNRCAVAKAMASASQDNG